MSLACAGVAALRHGDRYVDRRRVAAGLAAVVSFTFGMHGEFGLSFVRLPHVERGDIILAPGQLEAIEAHAIGISDHAGALRAARQHVKRGLLLYGPPGTGKSHTISYLASRMRDRTTIVLTGGAVRGVGQAGTIARSLQPATIIIEDVDLIPLDRHLPGGEHNALLFQLLNEMDGLAEHADVLFVLTTNRVDMLEPALAARPGRIDRAIELSLPGPDARRRLLELYTHAPLPDDAEQLVRRLGGVAPAFIKELARRAELVRLNGTSPAPDALGAALDAMLEHATPVLRRSLAAHQTRPPSRLTDRRRTAKPPDHRAARRADEPSSTGLNLIFASALVATTDGDAIPSASGGRSAPRLCRSVRLRGAVENGDMGGLRCPG